MKTTLERFLDYVCWDTCSDEKSVTVPSTPGQIDFAKYLTEELTAMGIEDVRLDNKGYIYGSLPANVNGDTPTIGFIAHMDTSSAHPSVTRPSRIIDNYDGDIITLESGMTIDPDITVKLADCKGQTLVVTDGYTLLGGDDKAGVAEIVTALEYLLNHPEVKHGRVAFSFTPDEEIGASQDNFSVEEFGADFAYTIDGGSFGEIDFENFFAASAAIRIKGVATHPGEAKNQMKNASLIAMEYDHLLPPWERPEHTEGYEGFYHLESISGDCENCSMEYLVREHDREKFEERKETMKKAAEFINRRYGAGTADIAIKESYRNMAEIIRPHMHIIDNAREAIRQLGNEPLTSPIRGGTDGKMYSARD